MRAALGLREGTASRTLGAKTCTQDPLTLLLINASSLGLGNLSLGSDEETVPQVDIGEWGWNWLTAFFPIGRESLWPE